jgi:hypothetical protein
MNAIFTTTFCPQVATKVFWIKANRVLAWSLIVSPPLLFVVPSSGAANYAFRRWGMRAFASDTAVLLVFVYLVLSVLNLVRG